MNLDATNTAGDEWEYSKENVQPMREGRNFLSMSSALQSDGQFEVQQRLKDEKRLKHFDNLCVLLFCEAIFANIIRQTSINVSFRGRTP